MRTRILFFILLFAVTHAVAQNATCGFDQLMGEMNTDSSYRQKAANVNSILFDKAIHSYPGLKTSQTVLEVPVVVHIVHQGGPENISDSLILASIDQLNLRFQNASPYYDSTGLDIQIQFCLASVDPYGNPTTGITRTISSYTDVTWNTGPLDAGLKNLNRWDPHLYMNIWVVRNIISVYGYVGYSTYPANMGTASDGVVIRYDYLNNYITTHEAGHYLGLYHTFEHGCTNGNCLLDGDQVCDTPPDASNNFVICPTNTCSTEMDDTSGFNPFITDMNELPDYMDYTLCPLSFSVGQSDRMNASLTQIRTTLLQSNGCGQNAGGAVPVASFTFSNGCWGTTFNNTSLNSVGAQWDFDNDGIMDDCGNSVTHVFPAIGNYSVTLYAAGFGGSDSITQTVFAQPYPYQNYPMINSLYGIGPSLLTGQLVFCQGSTISFHGEPGMVSYLWSNGDTTQDLIFIGDSAFSVSLTAIDSAGLVWTVCFPIHADPVAATIPPVITIAGNDTVFCYGDTITLLFNYSPLDYYNTFHTSWTFYPNWTDTSFTTTLALNNLFWIDQTDSNACHSTSGMLSIPAQYTIPIINISQNGNTLYYPFGDHYIWYLNGVPIPGSDTAFYLMTQTGCYTVFAWYQSPDCGNFASDTVCVVINGLEVENENSRINIFPVPFSDQLNVIADRREPLDLALFDVLSREVLDYAFTSSTTLNTKHLAKGIYNYELRSKGILVKRGKVIKN